jgi:hypothetical protein
MQKSIAFWVAVFILGLVFTGSANSGGGIASTHISATVTIAETDHIHVDSTENFLTTDFIMLENEQIAYTGKTTTTFTGLTRAYGGTTAAIHVYNALTPYTAPTVYNQEANVINASLNANITAVAATSGWFSVVSVPFTFFKSLPNLFNFDQPWFQGDMALVGYLFLAFSIGMIISLAFGMLWVATGIIKLF